MMKFSSVFVFLWLTPAIAKIDANIPDLSKFKKLDSVEGQDVLIHKGANEKHPWISATKVFPKIKASVFAAKLSDFKSYARIFADIVDTDRSKWVEEKNGMSLLHLVWDMPWVLFLDDLDALVWYHATKSKDAAVITWSSLVEKREKPAIDGKRIQDVRGRTDIKNAATGGAEVTYTYYADLGHKFSESMTREAYLKEPVAYFAAIEKWASK